MSCFGGLSPVLSNIGHVLRLHCGAIVCAPGVSGQEAADQLTANFQELGDETAGAPAKGMVAAAASLVCCCCCCCLLFCCCCCCCCCPLLLICCCCSLCSSFRPACCLTCQVQSQAIDLCTVWFQLHANTVCKLSRKPAKHKALIKYLVACWQADQPSWICF